MENSTKRWDIRNRASTEDPEAFAQLSQKNIRRFDVHILPHHSPQDRGSKEVKNKVQVLLDQAQIMDLTIGQ